MIHLITKISKPLWIPIIWTLIIIWLLCIPGTGLPSLPKWWKFPGYDKIIHFILFGSFVIVWSFHYEKIRLTLPVLWKRLVVVFTIISMLLGIVLEFVQRDYIPNRSFDVNDIYADVLGALLAGLLLYFGRSPGKK